MWSENTLRQKRSLFVSAGHSETDIGAHGNGRTEAGVVLTLRDLLCDELDQRGIVVTRDGDPGQNLPLREACDMAARHDVAVELHLNAATPDATGVETLSRPESKTLGKALCDAVGFQLDIPVRGAKSESSGRHTRLAFVSDGGGIILETFFITNASDMRSYEANQMDLVEALADVLMEEVTA